jgi:hypothetical protein
VVKGLALVSSQESADLSTRAILVSMDVEVTPPLEDAERQALLAALERVEPPLRSDPYRQAWRSAGLREAVDAEAEVAYAFSPRSTRGATRA